jgi:hypothetical protein
MRAAMASLRAPDAAKGIARHLVELAGEQNG